MQDAKNNLLQEWTIPNHILCRNYTDSVVILADARANRLILLEGNLAKLWNKVVSNLVTSFDENDFHYIEELIECGAIKMNNSLPHIASPKTESTPTKFSQLNSDKLHFSIVSQFALMNQLPLSGQWEITRRCNLRCKHCYSIPMQKNTLETRQLIHIIDQLHNSGTLALTLTGGEPFMRPDIVDILNYLAKRQFMIRINTNGTLITSKLVERLSCLKNIHRIHISLYGATAQIHDAITGVAGSFTRTIKTLHALHEASIPLRINCSIMKTNFTSYQTILSAIAKPLGIPVQFDATLFPRDDGSTDNLHEELSKRQKNKFTSLMKQSPFKKEYLIYRRCKAATSFFCISENGSLYPCLRVKKAFKKPLGNLITSSMQEVWFASSLRKKLAETCTPKKRLCDSHCDAL